MIISKIKFHESDEGLAFIATADSRQTSTEIMRAIAFMARNRKEAEAMWEGDLLGESGLLAIWEHATNNGLRDASGLYWGASGNNWANMFDA
jgi:hypothetical protein